MSDALKITRDNGVVTLTMNEPKSRNALSDDMRSSLSQAIHDLSQDTEVQAVILTGSGGVFCAGGDLGWMQQQMAADAETRGREARVLAEALMLLNTLPKPLIGALQGNAFGGGVGMASVCDVAIGVDHLKMGLTETKLGLIPATIGPYVVARMGEARARRVFMSARLFGAAEAVELGLLAKAVPAQDLASAVEAEVAPYLSCAPGAVAAAKKLTRDLGPRLDDAVIDMTIQALVERWEGEEAREGIEAFFAKRKPAWQG